MFSTIPSNTYFLLCCDVSIFSYFTSNNNICITYYITIFSFKFCFELILEVLLFITPHNTSPWKNEEKW
nr:MAG TPA: hypothetical protein [Caudoviricetes sp.]